MEGEMGLKNGNKGVFEGAVWALIGLHVHAVSSNCSPSAQESVHVETGSLTGV